MSTETKTRLAILGTRGIPAKYGGYETFAEELSTRLVQRDVEVTVFCQTAEPRPSSTYRGVRLEYVPLPALGPFTQMMWDALCFWRARGKYDVVYMCGTGGAFMAWAPRIHGARVWINTDGIEWKRTKWNLLQRAYVRVAEATSVLLADKIIADSYAIEDYLKRTYRRFAKVATIAYGAYANFAPPSPHALNEWNLRPRSYHLVVCRLEPENHILEIVKGYVQSKAKFPLIVLGDISNPNGYVQELLSYKSERVRFAGTVYEPSRLVPLRYFSATYLHGHSVGGTNPSLLEAMACSNLVIAHDNPFNREVLGGAGMFFKSPDDVAALIEKVESGEANEAARAEAVKIIRERYDWDQITNSYALLLNEERMAGVRVAKELRSF